jgi:Ala-tRNA(Pro) deacylase
MPISKKLIKKLDDLSVKYEIIAHRKVYTAYDAAQTTKRKLEQIVKSLMVKAGGTYYLIHVPANKNINLDKLAKILDVKKVTIPNEKQITKALKIKPGSLTSFGFMHKVETVIDKNLMKVKKAVFSSGSLTESIEMPVKEFAKLTDNYIDGVFTIAKKIKKQKVVKRKKKNVKKKPKPKPKKR